MSLPEPVVTFSTPKRFGWQFSLRTLFVFTSFVAVLLATWQCIEYFATRRARAERILLGLGARITRLAEGNDTYSEVYFSDEWTGGDQGLSYLVDMPDVRHVFFSARPITVFSGPPTQPRRLGAGKSTNVTDGAIPYLGRIKNLQWLDLTGTNVTGDQLGSLRSLSALRLLDLKETAIRDEFLKHLKETPRLESLNLCKTAITDHGIANLAEIKSLRWLDLAETALTDASIQYLCDLKSLKCLIVSKGSLTPEGLENLRKRLPNCEIVVLQ
jgi:hypothetical protein